MPQATIDSKAPPKRPSATVSNNYKLAQAPEKRLATTGTICPRRARSRETRMKSIDTDRPDGIVYSPL